VPVLWCARTAPGAGGDHPDASGTAASGRCLDVSPVSPEVYGGFLRRRGWEYTCIDKWRTGNPYDPRAVGFVHVEADLCDLSAFEDGSFDLVIVQHVIEEIPDYRRALSELARVLSPLGTALLEIPFDPRRPESEQTPPNHFGNVWRFGADLRDTVRELFPTVFTTPLEQNDYRSVVFIARHEVEAVDEAEAARRQAAEYLEPPVALGGAAAPHAMVGERARHSPRKSPD
jgi:SAM-dependent methyltransferase